MNVKAIISAALFGGAYAAGKATADSTIPGGTRALQSHSTSRQLSGLSMPHPAQRDLRADLGSVGDQFEPAARLAQFQSWVGGAGRKLLGDPNPASYVRPAQPQASAPHADEGGPNPASYVHTTHNAPHDDDGGPNPASYVRPQGSVTPHPIPQVPQFPQANGPATDDAGLLTQPTVGAPAPQADGMWHHHGHDGEHHHHGDHDDHHRHHHHHHHGGSHHHHDGGAPAAAPTWSRPYHLPESPDLNGGLPVGAPPPRPEAWG